RADPHADRLPRGVAGSPARPRGRAARAGAIGERCTAFGRPSHVTRHRRPRYRSVDGDRARHRRLAHADARRVTAVVSLDGALKNAVLRLLGHAGLLAPAYRSYE